MIPALLRRYAPLTALVFAAFLLAAGSAAATPPQPLWIAEADGALAVTAADGTVLFELDELHQVRAAAADLERATVWLLAEGRLHAHGFDGAAQFAVDVATPASVHAELAADPRDGTVWLAVNRTLLGFDRHGQLVAEQALPGVAETVAVDDVAGRLWVATGSGVEARDPVSGAVVAELGLGPGERVRDLDVDRLRGTVWVALRDELRAYDGDGTLLWSTTVRKLETIAADGAVTGGAWAATKKELLRVDADGTVVASVEPFGGRGVIGELAVAWDRSVWAANATDLAHVSPDGELLQLLTLDPPARIWDLATPVDASAPTIAILAPEDGAIVDTATPAVELAVGDVGSGVDVDTVEVLLDGAPLAADCTFEDGADDGGTGLCQPLEPLPAGEHTLSVTVADRVGNRSEPATVTFEIRLGPALPPDPSTVAPALDRTAATDFHHATAFLYTGEDPIQRGVEPGVIEPRRAAVVRGWVLDRAGEPLPGVAVTVHGQPEYGNTLTRADGAFDLAVNGGGTLTLRFEREGYLPVDRQVKAPWRDYVWAPEVALTPLDPAVTVVENGAAEAQVARGTLQVDADGERTATLIFPAGTSASLVHADGTVEPLASLAVRATEYTVGSDGLAAMPGPLPKTVAYTYAVELSADEALASGAVRVDFDRPLAFYLENFLGFPVGEPVPSGYYDRVEGRWIGSENGRVIAVVGVDGSGRAELDLDGSGASASAEALASLGIDDAERRRVASLYPVGQSLWRVPIPHFTPWDCNWPYVLPDGAVPPPGDGEDDDGDDDGDGDGDGDGDDGSDPDAGDDDPDEDDPCLQSGSVIECENQILHESVSVTGTGLRLHYHSDLVPGRLASYLIRTRLSGAEVPSSLKRIELEVTVGGRRWRESYAPAPNLEWSLVWDGADGYGRLPQGGWPVTLRKGYVYEVIYGSPAEQERSWAQLPDGEYTTEVLIRGEVTLWREREGTLETLGRAVVGGWDARAQGLGGWSLGVHHFYDPNARLLYLGSGGRRSGRQLGPVVRWAAGRGSSGFDGDGGPATEARLRAPSGVAVGADGTVYVADTFNRRVRSVDASGVIRTFAGTGAPCGGDGGGEGAWADPSGGSEVVPRETGSSSVCNDGAPAVLARLNGPYDVATTPDGSVLIADSAGCVRRVNGLGVISTVAGVCRPAGGSGGAAVTDPVKSDPGKAGLGDGGPATEAFLGSPRGLAVAPDGSFYVTDAFTDRVRFVGTDGRIHTVAGGGWQAPAEGLRGVDVDLDDPTGLALGADGSLYLTERGGHRVWRLGVGGRLALVAGSGEAGSDGDGGSATEARLRRPWGLAVAADGTVYVGDEGNRKIRRIGPGGVIQTLAGTGFVRPLSNGGPAAGVSLVSPRGVALTPDGELLFADAGHHGALRTGLALEGFAEGEIVIAGRGRGVLYVFDPQGRHLRTVHALTGAVLVQFGYDDEGRLATVEDGDGLVTTVERDAGGAPTGIVGPFGQRTGLTVGDDGYLAAISNPADETATFTYHDGGLLASWSDPLGHTRTADYDFFGRLLREDDPAGGFQELARYASSERSTVIEHRTAEGRQTLYGVVRGSNGVRRWNRDPSGFTSSTLSLIDGTATVDTPEGVRTVQSRGPDPRFGMQTPVGQRLEVTLPSGLGVTVTGEREVTLADLDDPLSVVEIDETVEVDGRPFTRRYEGATRTVTTATPEGRKSTVQLSPQGRPLEVSAGGLAPVRYRYRPDGLLAEVRQGEGDAERVVAFTYDARGRLETVTDPLDRVTAFGYDDADRPVTATRPDGQAVTLRYDAAGRLIGVTPPERPEHGFAYTPMNRLSEYDPPELGSGTEATTYLHNLDHQPTEILRPDGRSVHFVYDDGGRLDTVSLPRGPIRHLYHPSTGQLRAVGDPGGGWVHYTHDGPLLVETSWSGEVAGTVERGYGSSLRLRERTVNGEHRVERSYDDDGLLMEAGELSIVRDPRNGFVTGTTLGAVTTTEGHDAFGDWEETTAAVAGTELWAVVVVRDKLGRITRKEETLGSTTRVHDYGYDLAGRLIEVHLDGTLVEHYDHDANGNRRTATYPPGTVTATYDDQDRLLTYGPKSYTYTAAGELATVDDAGEVTTLDYDAAGNLLGVELPSGVEIEYLVDGRHRRIGKRVNGTLVQGFLYQDLLNPIAELDGAGNVTARFVYATRGNVPDYVVKEEPSTGSSLTTWEAPATSSTSPPEPSPSNSTTTPSAKSSSTPTPASNPSATPAASTTPRPAWCASGPATTTRKPAAGRAKTRSASPAATPTSTATSCKTRSTSSTRAAWSSTWSPTSASSLTTCTRSSTTSRRIAATGVWVRCWPLWVGISWGRLCRLLRGWGGVRRRRLELFRGEQMILSI